MDFLRLFSENRALGWLPTLVVFASLGWMLGGVAGYPWRERVRDVGVYQLAGTVWGLIVFGLVVLAAAVRHQHFALVSFNLLAPVRGIPWLCGRINLWKLHRAHRGRIPSRADWVAKRRGDAAGLVLVLAGMALAQWPVLHAPLALAAGGAVAGLALVAAGDLSVVRALAYLRELATVGLDKGGGHAIGPRRLILLGTQGGIAGGVFALLVGWHPGGWMPYAPVLGGCASLTLLAWWRTDVLLVLLTAARTHAPGGEAIARVRRAARGTLAVALGGNAVGGAVALLALAFRR